MPLNICVASSVMLLYARSGVAGVRIVGVDRNLHVEPLVAVDDVIAAAAHDRVAAVAAEDDVAGAVNDGPDRKRVKLRLGQAKHLPQAADAGNAFRVSRLPR